MPINPENIIWDKKPNPDNIRWDKPVDRKIIWDNDKNSAPSQIGFKPKYDISETPASLTEPSFFEGYYRWLNSDYKPAGFWDWMNTVVPKSFSKTAIGVSTFPYFTTKSFTDPLIRNAEDMIEGEKPRTPLQLKVEMGMAVWDLVQGMSEFFGAGIGVYGWEEFKKKWTQDPAAGFLALQPFLRGAGRAMEYKAEAKAVSPKEFGEKAASTVEKTAQGFYDWIDIEAPFQRIGAEKTGIAFKQSPSISISEQKRFMDVAKSHKKLKINEADGYEVTLRTAELKRKPVGEGSLEVEQAARANQAYYQEAFKRAKEDGILKTEWPDSQLIRNQNRINNLKEILSKKKASPVRVAKMKKEISEISEINQNLKQLDPQYTHIPLSVISKKLRDALGEETGHTILNNVTSKFFRGRFFHQRKTLDIKPFFEELLTLKDKKGNAVFTPLDFDYRMIGASYAQQLGAMRGLANIFKNAKKEGLVIRKKEAPPEGFGEAPPELKIRFPELRNHYIQKAFSDNLDYYLKKSDWGMELGRFFGYTKMMSFINPIILPAYDMWQATWPRSVLSVKTPKAMRDAVKSWKNRDAAYYEASEGAAFSTPFIPPFENYVRDVKNTIYQPLLEKALEKSKRTIKNPLVILDGVYRANWNMAWGGDNLIRLMTYHYLKGKGHTPLDSAQLTAYFHGDYAKLTPKSRKILNKIFFTPSFKYVMGHVQANMIKSSVKVLDNAMRLRQSSKRDMLLAQGATMLLGGLMAKDYLMKHWGFEPDAEGLRYIKKTMTDEGEKELVVYWPDPNNVLLRQVHKWKKWGDEPDKLAEFFNKAHWDFHPIWKLSYELLRNDSGRSDKRNIYNPFDDSRVLAKDIIHHSLRSIVGMERLVEDYIREKGAKEAYNAVSKDLGKFHAKFFSAVAFAYLRQPEDMRTMQRVKNLNYLFKNYWRKDEHKTDKQAEMRFRNFFKRIDKEFESLNQEDKKEINPESIIWDKE
jgi:hypothetical protein